VVGTELLHIIKLNTSKGWVHCKCYVKRNDVRCTAASFRPEKKTRSSVSQPKQTEICAGKPHKYFNSYTGLLFSLTTTGCHLLSGTFIVLTSPTRTTAQTRVGKWQTTVFWYRKDPVRSISDPSISRVTATEHNKLSTLYRLWRKLLHFVPCYTSQGWWPLATPSRKQPTRTNPTRSYRDNSCLYPWIRQVAAWTSRVPPGHPPLRAHIVLPTLTSHRVPSRSSLAAGPHKFHRFFSAHTSHHTDERKLITSLNLLHALRAALVAVQTLSSAPLVTVQTLCWAQFVAVQPLFLFVTDAAAVFCWFLVGDIVKRRAHCGFAAEGRQILGPLSLPHRRSPSPLCTPPVTNQQVNYAHVLRTGMTTGTFNTICVQECDLLREYAGFRRPEMMLVGTDVTLSIYVAPFLPLAVMILLTILGQD
jgi:hypothetical protein